VAVKAAEEALQILGGMGYLKDYATERYYRDAKQLMIVEGTSEIHRLIISRALADGLLDWGYDVEAAGGLPHDEADRARRARLRDAARAAPPLPVDQTREQAQLLTTPGD
jgi:hypothetical protein